MEFEHGWMAIRWAHPSTGPSFKVDKSCLAKPNLLLPTSTSHSSVLDIRRALWLAVKVTGEIARPGAMWASF
jgi:hypothetical protein